MKSEETDPSLLQGLQVEKLPTGRPTFRTGFTVTGANAKLAVNG